MTRLRYAVLLLSVVLFTLALGIALGGGPLQGPIRGTLQSQVAAVTDDGVDEAALTRRNHVLSRSARFDRGFAQALSPQLLGDRLAGQSVVVLALPGVPAATSEAVAADISAAGGTVTSTLGVGRELVDPTARPLVDELSKRLLADLDDVEVPEDASVYRRAGEVAARALLTSEDGGYPLDEAGRSVFNTLTTARLLRGEEPEQRASTALVLVPEAGRSTPASGGRGLILSDLLSAFDEAGDGVVVGGPPSAAQRHGLVAAVRRNPATAESVSTVDATGVRSGQIAAVLALAEQADGGAGHYGVASGAESVLPDGALAE